ncbi:transmembrane protein, putative (macronuclear) [Tetrahymena thermophila SB210]|uniref:Transmembrane protein, putative n=1 Tax=Tetrahymena thermophila (strain SB210) TaxID=312017 RepID=W7XJ84_TETTS|nr:transmembrane protein, putative [Tetrahymena thermophila SB210]EWS75296.1 transmembrane protein, putative [Tetrahymena thermophila SB210]|eukprot:XP_012652287.1 transmembrane protein, putative [Tetrahymena thermophila SB210]
MQPTDIDQIDSSLIIQNCNLFVSASLGTSGFAYCLVCNQDYSFDINGVCNTNQQLNPKSPRPQVKNLFQASKIKSIMSSASDPSQSNIQFQINQDEISDFLVIGYFKLTSWSNNLKKIPLLTVSVQSEWYNFLNFYLNSDTNLELKQIIDNLNDVEIIQQQLPFSILNRWLVFGIGYQLNQQLSYAIYQDIYTNQLQKIQISSQYQLDSRITALSVQIGSQAQAISLFSSFVGQVSSLKIIQQPFIQNLQQYQFIFEGNSGDLGLLNPNFQKIVSLKDIYTFNYDADLIIDCIDNYFFQGVCINQLYCSELGSQQQFLGVSNSMFADQNQQACNYCDSTCIQCTSQTVCLACQVGYFLDQNSQCIPCNSSQYYDLKLSQCVDICSIGYYADKINQICIQNFDLQQYQILPKFQLSYFFDNEGFYQIDTFGDIQINQYTICFIDFSYQGYSFFGSISSEAGYSVYMQWEGFPAHYKKQVNFYVVLFSSQNINDLQVQINGIQAQFIQSQLVTQSLNQCQGSSAPLNLYQVYYELLNNDSNYQLAIQTSGQGFAVRNVNVSVQKCHNTCISCQNGPNQTDCIECELGNASKIDNQCVCQQNEYAYFMNCYSPPCFKCNPCILSNCSQCEDFTGNCLKCQTGFVIQDGQCQKACNQFYSIDKSQANQICVKAQDLIISNFIDGRVVQYLDFWNLSFQYTNPFSCFEQSFLPDISQGQYYQLQYNFNNFQSYHNQIAIQIGVIEIGQFSSGDQILISESNEQVLQQPIQSNQLSCSTLSDYQSSINQIQIAINKANGQINFIFQANTNPGTNQENLSIGQFLLFFQYSLFVQVTIKAAFYALIAFRMQLQTQKDIVNAKKDTITAMISQKLKLHAIYVMLLANFVADLLFGIVLHALKVICMMALSVQFATLDFILINKNQSAYLAILFASSAQALASMNAQVARQDFIYIKGDALKIAKQLILLLSMMILVNSVFKVELVRDRITQIYLCGQNQDDMVGLYFQLAQFVIPSLQPHQTMKIYFQLYITSSCLNCSIQLISQNGQVIGQTVNIQQQDCDINSLISFSFIIQDSSFVIQDYLFTVSFVENINFAIRNIQVSTIICHPTCAKCSGPLETDCTECPINAELDPINKNCKCTQLGFGFGISDQSLCNSQFSCLSCVQCQYPCKTCYAANVYSCNSCAQNYIPFLEYCVQQCPSLISLQYLNKQTNQIVCLPCPKPCLECNSNGNCLSCLNGYLYLKDKQQCLTSCPTNNYYLDISTNTCLNCHYSCLSCSGPTQYDCINCIDGMYYDNQLNVCDYCNSLCQTCIQSTNYDCIQCSQDVTLFQPASDIKICTVQCDEYPGYFLEQYTDQQSLQVVSTCSKCAENCLSCYSSQNGCYQCSDGFYLNENYECDPCDDSCLTCFSYKQNNCLSCIQSLVLYNGQCVQQCPLQYYINQLPNNKKECILCPSQCIACTSNQNCFTCAYGYYKQDTQCLMCQNNCEICYGLQGMYCQKCRSSYYLQNSLCVQQCQVVNNIGYYMDIASRTCKQCDQSCHECFNPQSTGCKSCRDGYYLLSGICYGCPSNSLQCYYDDQQKQILAIQCANPYFLFQGFCKKSCPLNFYQDVASNTCKLCNLACSQCTGPLSQQCQQCNNGYFYAGQNTCLPCQQGSGVGVYDCISCSSFNYCLKCQTLINFNGMCLSQCLENYYFNQQQQNCQRCNFPCLNCSDQNTCTSCIDGYYLLGDYCLKCDVKCKTCNGGTDQDCLLCNQPFMPQQIDQIECVIKCSIGYYQTNYSCLKCNKACSQCIDQTNVCEVCAEGYYKNSDQSCQPCEDFCQICTGINSCTQCQNGYLLFQGTCLEQCPEGYLNSNGICIPCNSNCKSCQISIDNCVSCNDGYYILNNACLPCVNNCSLCSSSTSCTKCQLGYFLEDSICKTQCQKEGFYQDYTQYMCLPCDASCRNCISGAFNKCLNCYDGYYLENDPQSQRCLPCNSLCTQCFGASNSNCLRCRLGVKFDQINQTCISCPSKQFYNSQSGVCEQCSPSCLECFGPSKNNCISCNASTFLNIDTDTCEACFPSCMNCYNGQQCIKCQQGFYLIDNQYCLQQCPNQMRVLDDKCLCNETCAKCTYDPINNQSICIRCINDEYLLYDNQSNCIKITECQYYKDYTTNSCTEQCPSTALYIDLVNKACQYSQCSDNQYLFNSKYCISSCPDNFYADSQNICQPCNYKCQKCFGPSDNNCIECIQNYYFHQGINACQDSCIQGYVLQQQNNYQCQVCKQNCKACVNSLVLFQGDCLQNCPQGFSENAGGYCFYNPDPSIRIYNLQQNQTISLIQDTQIEASLFSNNNPTRIQWDIIQTNDNSFVKSFQTIQSFDLFQLIPYIILSPSSYYIFRITIELTEDIQLQDSDSQSSFVFFISDWQYDQIIYYDLSFYEVFRILESENLNLQDGSNSNNNNKIYDFYKDNLFRVHKHIQIEGPIQFTYTFQPISVNVNLFCELKVYDDFNYDTVYQYILLQVNSYDLPEDQIAAAESTLNIIKSSNNDEVIQNLIFNYSFQMRILIVRDQEKEQSLKNQINLRSIAYLSGIDATQLSLCDNTIDCYGNGKCIDQVDGQILQRSSSYVISQLQGLNIDIQDLIQLNQKITQMISSSLNIGDKLISYSDSSNFISYPYLITSSANTTQSNRRMLQNSQQDSLSKQNITLSLNSFTVQFPAEIIQSTSKQVIVAQQWTQDPRQAPFAVSQTVSLQVQQNGIEMNVQNTNQPIIITLPKIIPSPISEDTSSISCSFYDEITNSFQNEGCTFVKETILNIVCSCTHLTDFTAQKIQNQSVKNYIDLGSLITTMNQGQEELQNLNQKIAIISLPTLAIGQRQVSLVTQLQVIQSGGINQFLQRNMIFLKEDPDYVNDNLDILHQDLISLYYDQEINQTQSTKSFQINKLQALFYMLIVLVFVLHISMRACLRFKHKLLNNEYNRIKIQKKKFEKAKTIQKKFDMSKFKFTLQKQRASIKKTDENIQGQDKQNAQKKDSVIKFQDQEQETIFTQSPPLISLELESIFSPKNMKLETNKSKDQVKHMEKQNPHFQQKQDQEPEFSIKGSSPSFTKSNSTMAYDQSKSPNQYSISYKRSIFSRNQVTYMRFNQTDNQFTLTQDECADDNQNYDTKCTDGNLITENDGILEEIIRFNNRNLKFKKPLILKRQLK